MNWLKGSTSAENSAKPFGHGHFDDEDLVEPTGPRPSAPSAHPASAASANSAPRSVVGARRASVADRTGTAPAPSFEARPTAAQEAADSLRDWVAQTMEEFKESVQTQLEIFRKQLDDMQVKQASELITVKAGIKLNSDLSKRAQTTSAGAIESLREMEELVKSNSFDHSSFSELKTQVTEAVRYLDDESRRRLGKLSAQSDHLQSVLKKSVAQAFKDYKDLDLRLTIQSLAASTFSLKVAAMSEEARAKSMRYLEGEENRVKAIRQQSPRERLSMEDILEELSRELPSKPRPQRPSLLGGPGELVPAESQRQQTRGLVELLSAEIFCINAVANDDFTRKMLVEVLKKHVSDLRSATTTAAALEAIHAEALAAPSADIIPAEIDKPLVVAATDRRISFTERL